MNGWARWPVGLVVGVSLLVGCASVDPGPAFEDVRRDVTERTGQEVLWIRDTAEDAEVNRRVEDMLKGELSVDQAVQIALLNNRRLQAAYQSLGIAQAQLVQAGLLKNPVFDASYRFVDGAGGDGVLEMRVVESFIDVLLIPMKKRLAEAELQQAQLSVSGAVMDLAHRVRVAHVQLAASQQQVRLWQTSVDAAEAGFDVARRLVAAGNVTELELFSRQADYEQARLSLSAVEAQVLADRERLAALMGLGGNRTAWRTAEELPAIPDKELDIEESEKRAMMRSLDLAIARQEVKMAASAAGVEVAGVVLEDIDVGVHAERDPGDLWAVGPAVVLPLPIFDQGQASRHAARAELRQRWEMYLAITSELRAAARAARNKLDYARSRAVQHRQVVLPLYRQITAQTLLQYNAMQLGVQELLLARQRELDAERQASEALADYWIARNEMELILSGRLPAGTLDADVDAVGNDQWRFRP